MRVSDGEVNPRKCHQEEEGTGQLERCRGWGHQARSFGDLFMVGQKGTLGSLGLVRCRACQHSWGDLNPASDKVLDEPKVHAVHGQRHTSEFPQLFWVDVGPPKAMQKSKPRTFECDLIWTEGLAVIIKLRIGHIGSRGP